MLYNLFLDDIRFPEYINDGRKYTLARSFEEAVKLIEEHGLPAHIAFDHDLGWNDLEIGESGLIEDVGRPAKSGYDFAKWLVDQDLEGKIDIPKTFTWSIHSSNPAGAANIHGLLKNYLDNKYAI